MAAAAIAPRVRGFHEPVTGTISYVVDAGTGTPCIIIDPVLDYDPVTGRFSTASIDRVQSYLSEENLQPQLVLETHIHADHVSAAQLLRTRFDCKVAIGARVREVQDCYLPLFAAAVVSQDPPFDLLLEDNTSLCAGSLQVQVLSTPGHTPSCVSYVIGDCVFVGDVLLMPDSGTARCDFPGGSAGELFDSIQKLLALPETTQVYVAHDYGPEGRQPAWRSDVRSQRRDNIHLADNRTREEFVRTRQARDRQLAPPRLIIPSLQINIMGGRLPAPSDNGIVYLKIPVGVF